MSRNRKHRKQTPDTDLAKEFAPQIKEFMLLGRDVFRTTAPHGAPRLTVEDGVVFEATRHDSPRFLTELWISEEYMEPFAAMVTEETFDGEGDSRVRTGGFVRRAFSIMEADLGGEFRSLVNPATRRFKPVPGAEYDVIVSWQYRQDRRSGQWMRRGMALPFDLNRVHKTVYEAPPATPQEANVVFMPSTDEHGNVTPTAILDQGYRLELKRTHAYVLEGKWGKPILVRLLNENPWNRTVLCSSRTVIGSALGEAEDVVAPVVGEDEVLVQGNVHKIWEVLKPFGATEEHGKRKLTSLRREMEKKLHPDTHGPTKAFKAMNRDVPAAVENKRKLDLELYRAAFERAEDIALLVHGVSGGLNDPEPKEAEAPKPATPAEPAQPVAPVAEAAPAEAPKPKAKPPARPPKPPKADAKAGRPATP